MEEAYSHLGTGVGGPDHEPWFEGCRTTRATKQTSRERDRAGLLSAFSEQRSVETVARATRRDRARQRTSHQARARLGAGGRHLKRARHPTAPAKPPRHVNVRSSDVSTASNRLT
jgi:hypothetical protein